MEKIKSSVDIIDVINNYTELKPAGRAYKGLCPFHSDKDPSFRVYSDTQTYYCFGCGAGNGGSDVISFIMNMENLDFKNTLSYLGERYNIDITLSSEDNQIIKLRKNISDKIELYHDNLKSLPEVLDNIKKERGLSDEEINKYKIGYNSNLSISKESTRTKDAIVIPIYDKLGRAVGVSNRILEPGENDPTYVNSTNNKVFEKGNVLYGLNFARPLLSSKKHLVLTEGYFDAISLLKYNIPAVATMGVLADKQIELIKQSTDSVILFFDQDKAGKDIQYNATIKLLGSGIDVKVVDLEDSSLNNLDPDDIVKKEGKNIYMITYKNQVVASVYYISKYAKNMQSKIAIARKEFQDKAQPILEALPRGAERNYVIEIIQDSVGKSKE